MRHVLHPLTLQQYGRLARLLSLWRLRALVTRDAYEDLVLDMMEQLVPAEGLKAFHTTAHGPYEEGTRR